VGRKGTGSAIDSRALECTGAALAALLAADALRALLGPSWRILKLLFGI
jgi:hypothetical protein